MRGVMPVPFIVGVVYLMTGCSSQNEPPSTKPRAAAVVSAGQNSLATRFTAAEIRADSPTRDQALRAVADAAAQQGDVHIMARTLWAMTDVKLKDQTAFQSAVSLPNLGRHDGAQDLVKWIADCSLRDEAGLAISR